MRKAAPAGLVQYLIRQQVVCDGVMFPRTIKRQVEGALWTLPGKQVRSRCSHWPVGGSVQHKGDKHGNRIRSSTDDAKLDR